MGLGGESYFVGGSKILVLGPSDTNKWLWIRERLKRLGFGLSPEDEATSKALLNVQQKKDLKRLAVAGAMVGNMMLFIVPVYAGLQGPLRQKFLWISFFLFIPVLFYSAAPIWQGLWLDVKNQTLSIDSLIGFAAGTTSLISFYHLIQGSDQVYFDSTASFLFLILLTRQLMDFSRTRFLKPLFLGELLQSTVFSKSNGDRISAEQVRAGDQVLLAADQVLPFDAVCLSPSALFSSSYIDGESLPKVYGYGQALRSGLKSLQNDVLVRSENPMEESQLSQFLRKLNQNHLNQSASIQSADRLASRLMLFVVMTAVLVFFSGIWIGFEDSLQRSLALLVIACPCALAFAAPLTVGSFIRQMTEKGIFVKDARVFESLQKARTYFFDKTGTVTETRMVVSSTAPSLLPVVYQQIIVTLEKDSVHPVAFALREKWIGGGYLDGVTEVQEVPGQGVRGLYEGSLYELRKLPEGSHVADYAVGFFRDDQLIVEIYFECPLRPQSKEVIETLLREKKQVFLLSGDQRSRVLDVGRRLGIGPEHCFSEVFPEEKENILSRFSNAVMVGDGVNDALAFKKASVGISLQGDLSCHQNLAHVSIASSRIDLLLELLLAAKNCQRTLRRNYSLALVYNFAGATLAILGLIGPLAAALAMPLSSFLILLSTLWGVRWRS